MELVELTEYLVKQVLPEVDNIQVSNIESNGDIVIQVLVPNEYMSKIIGKGGKIANSIRTIVQASAYIKKLGKVRINIDTL